MNIIRTAIARPVTVSMCVVGVILFGIVSLDRLALNLLPDISYPSLTIQTDYPDAAPEEIESLVTRPVEEAVGVVTGLTRISSTSRSGQSEVVLEFSWDSDMNLAALDVREKLDFVNLPRDVQKPVILRFDPSYDPIMRLRLYGDRSLSELRYAAEKEFKKALEATDGVAAVKVAGGVEEQIHVEIDEKRLAELGIPITEISTVLRQENLNQSAGSLYDLDASYLVRMVNQFRSVGEIKQIIVRSTAGRRIVLDDVAKVWRGARERTVIARTDGKESVELAIYKEGDANTVTVARAVDAKLAWLKSSDLVPANVQHTIVFNQADFIEQSVNNVLSAAVLGGLLATLVLFIFLRDLRSTLIIGFSIPISIMATFALMYQMDITLNIMSLGGVALGVGMLVDNSIVVLEAVHRRRQDGEPLARAVSLGTSEVGMAITASTLTTVAVFLPLIFVEGISGQLFKDQALTITFALLASLLVAITVIPVLLAMQFGKNNSLEPSPAASLQPRELSSNRMLRTLQRGGRYAAGKTRRAARFLFVDLLTVLLTDGRRLVRFAGRGADRVIGPPLKRFQRVFDRLNQQYPKLLLWSLNNKVTVIALTVALAALAGIFSLRLGAELIPPLTQGEFSFEIRLPEGTPLEQTNTILSKIESEVAEYPGVQTIFSSVGASAQNQFSRDVMEDNFGQLYVVMREKRDKTAEQDAITRTRYALSAYPEVTYVFSRPTLFSFKTPVEVEIYSQDLTSLQKAAATVAAGMAQIAGLKDVKTSTQPGNPELRIRFDRERLARLGLDETTVSNVLKNKIRGDIATRYRDQDRQIDVLVRAGESERKSTEDLKKLVINAAPGRAAGGAAASSGTENSSASSTRTVPITLGSVADIRFDRGPAEIRRIRSQRAAVVSANLSGRALSSVSEEIRRELQALRPDLPEDTTVTLGGQNEELNTSYQSLMFALGLAVFLVYLVTASQFESLIHPFVILFSVPLGLIGVILMLTLTGTTVSVMVLLGVIILAGIVVNNAIVLIDYANQLRKTGLSRREALLQSGQVRLRPILMTTLTTVLGLVPMAMAWGEGAEVRAPMAITVIGGLLFSTLLTLVFIPVLYELFDRKGVRAAESESLPVSGGRLHQHLEPAGGEPNA